MDETISEFSYSGQTVRWVFSGRALEANFDNPIKALRLASGTGLIVVEPASDEAPHNAIILNGDGSLRTRVRNPEAANQAIGYGDVYYVLKELTLIICFRDWQMGCVVDENGNVVRTYETR